MDLLGSQFFFPSWSECQRIWQQSLQGAEKNNLKSLFASLLIVCSAQLVSSCLNLRLFLVQIPVLPILHHGRCCFSERGRSRRLGIQGRGGFRGGRGFEARYFEPVSHQDRRVCHIIHLLPIFPIILSIRFSSDKLLYPSLLQK